MKSFIVESVQEIAQNPKIALGVTAAAAVNGGVQHWIEINIGWISGVIGLMGAITVTILQIKRSLREKKEHKLKVKLMEKELSK